MTPFASSHAKPASRTTGSMRPASRSRVAIDPLRGILTALGLPCASDSRHRGEPRAPARAGGRSRRHSSPRRSAMPVALAGRSPRTRRQSLSLEDGERQPVAVRATMAGPSCRRSRTPGYHRLRVGGPRDHARGRAAALRDARATSRRARSCGGLRFSSIRCGAPATMASATPARSRDLVRSAARAGRGRDRAQPDAQPVCRRSAPLRTLLAIEPAVPQPAVRRSSHGVRAGARRAPRATRRARAAARRADRLAGSRAPQACAAAPAVR